MCILQNYRLGLHILDNWFYVTRWAAQRVMLLYPCFIIVVCRIIQLQLMPPEALHTLENRLKTVA